MHSINQLQGENVQGPEITSRSRSNIRLLAATTAALVLGIVIGNRFRKDSPRVEEEKPQAPQVQKLSTTELEEGTTHNNLPLPKASPPTTELEGVGTGMQGPATTPDITPEAIPAGDVVTDPRGGPVDW